MKKFQLQVEAGDQAGAAFTLREGDNVLGRSRDTQIHLTSADVSSRHARFMVQGQTVVIVNLSQYGTTVGEKKLLGGESVQLEAGQLIRVGKNTLRLQEISGTPGEEIAPPPGSSPPSPMEAGATVLASPAADPQKTNAGVGSADDLAQADLSTGGGGVSKDFDQTMRAKAESADLAEPEEGPSSDKTFVQKTVFAPQEELDRRLAAERKKDRFRLLAILGGSILALTLVFVFWPKSIREGKLEMDGSYDIGEAPAPLGGYKILYPKNSSSKVKPTADGLIVSTQLGRKRDVRLLITLQEMAGDQWATQDDDTSLRDWMMSHPELTFGLPRGRFEGEQNGIWVWSVPYTRTGSETAVGEARVFLHGRRLEAIFSEVPAVDQGRAENMYKGCTYFEFPPEFEAAHWTGQTVTAKVVSATVFLQMRADLQREAPLTWAAITLQLRQILSQSVLEKRTDNEEQASGLLASLRAQQVRWYNSQRLLFNNAQRTGDAKGAAQITRRCQAVFSDQNDNRYFEVRKW